MTTAGATGYMTKESVTERLLQGIERVLNNEYFMDGAVSHTVVEKLMKSPEKEMKITDAGYETLTPREQEVAESNRRHFPRHEKDTLLRKHTMCAMG
jgi:DNA-binding NarL/FixJ family response regulator